MGVRNSVSKALVTICYDEVHWKDQSLTIGPSLQNRSGPIRNYWAAMCCFLAPEKMQPVGSDDITENQEPFVYLVELDPAPNDWILDDPDYQLIVLPPKVERAIRQRRAIVLVSYAHEGFRHFQAGRMARNRLLRSLSSRGPLRRQVQTSIFDTLSVFATLYDLSPEQLWFVSANVNVVEEESLWRTARGLSVSPFTLRQCEITSFGIGLAARESFLRGRGPATILEDSDHAERRAITLKWVPNPFSGYGIDDQWQEPKWRYSFLNRRFRQNRWWVLERLFDSGLLEYGYVSFPRMTPGMLKKVEDKTRGNRLDELLTQLPLHADIEWVSNPHEVLFYTNPENTHAVMTYPTEVARDSALQVVVETYYQNDFSNSTMFTEKSFKCLMGRGPAIIVGPRDTLKYLNSIGVETWSNVIDESYDNFGDWDLITHRPRRLDAAMDAVLPVIGDARESRKAVFACQSQYKHNLRWLIEADKPWDRLLQELESTLSSM